MTKQDIRAGVTDCFKAAFPHKSVPDFAQNFSQAGITSLEIAYLMFHIEKKFQIDLIELALHEAQNLNEYVAKIENART